MIGGLRKTVLFISDGIGYDIHDFANATQAGTVTHETREVIGFAGLFNVSIYALGVGGLGAGQDDLVGAADMPMVGFRPRLGSGDPKSQAIQNLLDDMSLGSGSIAEEKRRSLDSLRVLSSETGGIAVVNQNDLGEGLQRIARDVSRYYMLGFYPAGDLTDGKFRSIEVRVNRPDVSVRARKGYIASKTGALESSSTRREFESAADVLKNPLPVTGIPIRAFAVPISLNRDKIRVPVVAEADIQGFRFVEKNGKLHDQIDIAVIALNDQGEVVERKNLEFELALTPEIHDRMVITGFRSLAVLQLPPGDYRLRLGVYENGAGRTGSVFFDVEVPKPTENVMSGPILCTRMDDEIAIAATRKDKAQMPYSPSTRHRFAAAGDFFVYTEVYSPKARSVRSRLSIRTVIRRVGGVVVRQSEESAPVGDDTSPTHFVLESRFDLSAFSPGKYILTVQAREGGRPVYETRKVLFEVFD
jgi:hypothetical protein